jgi:exopolyphosphatase / guanosine-5'-triphosphate,3'-diphosphate pyrophosphatase
VASRGPVALSQRERARLKGLDRLRADTVVAGSQLAVLAMQAFGLERLILAPWALREGVIIDHLRREAAGVEAEDGEHPGLAAVVAFARRHGWDEAHARQVTKLALSLFDQTVHLHGLGSPERDLLRFAGLLHDVGAAVAQSAHHKHSLYIIGNAEIEGFTTRELKVMANVARYHRKALPSANHVEYMALSEEDRRLVRCLGALLRVADGLDLDHLQLVDAVRVRGRGDSLTLELHARDEPGLALWAVERLSDLFEAEFRRKLRPIVVQVE